MLWKKEKKELNNNKIKICVVDLNNHQQIVEALKGYDACLNGSSHHFNVNVMKACLETKTNYTDFGGLFHWARQQMELHEDFKKAGITAIVGSGSCPGIINVMAKYAVDRLDTVETVELQDFIINRGIKGYKLVPPYTLNTILDEFTANNFEFKNGEWIELPAFSGEEVVELPEPFGKLTLHNMIHSEVATMPVAWKDKGIKNVSFKLALPELFQERLRFMLGNGMGRMDPVMVDGQPVIPRNFIIQLIENEKETGQKTSNEKPDDHKVLRAIVYGKKANKNVKYVMESVMHPYGPWNMAMSPFTVGYPAGVTTKMLGRGQIKEKGAYPGESVIDTAVYFKELAKRSIFVTCETVEDIY